MHERLLSEVLALPVAERARFAQRLFESLEPSFESEGENLDFEAAWQNELAKRAEEINSGAVAAVPWDAARGNIRNELEKRRAGRSTP